jgi:hypothetical protein
MILLAVASVFVLVFDRRETFDKGSRAQMFATVILFVFIVFTLFTVIMVYATN